VAGDLVAAFLELLAEDVALLVPTLDEAAGLHAVHHLVERGVGAGVAIGLEGGSDVAAPELLVPEDAEDRELGVGGFGDWHSRLQQSGCPYYTTRSTQHTS
jgi:hypothetical protein